MHSDILVRCTGLINFSFQVANQALLFLVQHFLLRSLFTAPSRLHTIRFLSLLSFFPFLPFPPLPSSLSNRSLFLPFIFHFSFFLPGKFENFSYIPGSTVTTLLRFVSPGGAIYVNPRKNLLCASSESSRQFH